MLCVIFGPHGSWPLTTNTSWLSKDRNRKTLCGTANCMCLHALRIFTVTYRMNHIGFWFCVFIHWVLLGFTMFYVFFRTSKIYDTIYFIAICSIIVSWFFSGNECYISYLEKLCLDHSYKYESDRRLPFMEHVFPAMTHSVIFPAITLFTLYNLFIMMNMYKVPIPIMITIMVSYVKSTLSSVINFVSKK